MGWSDAQGRKGDGAPQDSSHLLIKANQTIKIHILLKEGEEPLSYWSHFIRRADGRNRSVICPGRDICPVCLRKTMSSRKRHAVNVWSYEDNAVKILEGGNSIFQQLKLIYDQFGGLDSVDIVIKRTGSTRDDTVYTVTAIQLAAPFEWGDKEQFDIDILKQPDSAEKINAMLSGNTTGMPTTAPRQAQEQPSSLATPTGISPVKLDFGKYKGMTMEEIATKDMNYVKWCAENIEDFTIKAEAQRLVNTEKTPQRLTNTGKSVSSPVTTPTSTERTNLMAAIQLTINEKYKNNFSEILVKMKQATASPTRPNGKTLLMDYTVEELKKLKEVIQ